MNPHPKKIIKITSFFSKYRWTTWRRSCSTCPTSGASRPPTRRGLATRASRPSKTASWWEHSPPPPLGALTATVVVAHLCQPLPLVSIASYSPLIPLVACTSSLPVSPFNVRPPVDPNRFPTICRVSFAILSVCDSIRRDATMRICCFTLNLRPKYHIYAPNTTFFTFFRSARTSSTPA